MIESLFPNGILPYLAGGICIGLAGQPDLVGLDGLGLPG